MQTQTRKNAENLHDANKKELQIRNILQILTTLPNRLQECTASTHSKHSKPSQHNYIHEHTAKKHKNAGSNI